MDGMVKIKRFKKWLIEDYEPGLKTYLAVNGKSKKEDLTPAQKLDMDGDGKVDKRVKKIDKK